MASLASITQSIADTLDKAYDNMLIFRLEDSVISCRARLVRQQFEKTKQFPTYAIYNCVLPLHEGKDYLYTDVVPKIIDVKDALPFSFVGTTGNEAITYILPEEAEFFKFNKVSGEMPRFTYMDKRIYIYNGGNIDNVLARGPFADPRQLAPFNCDDVTCFEDSDEFIEEHLVSIIKVMVLEEVSKRPTDDHNMQVNG